MVEESLETDGPRSSLPAKLRHPHSQYSQWKFKLFRLGSMEKAPVACETQHEKGASLGNPPPADLNKELDNGIDPGSVMKLCLGGKSKENVEGPGQRVDVKQQEMDTHMNQLR